MSPILFQSTGSIVSKQLYQFSRDIPVFYAFVLNLSFLLSLTL
ncbi:hypothetical protein LEP1GSC047_0782 [Leptospira inadai serovar Lyme str. 10]|uniref:Uncharacterized protein n=1 Tax=Leptospira inadai serovar Lyme str. 10 TaxID=1049790 RepID=V6HBU3_9LEPT|nr:hypothetical protein LEP1GSC047_0782 [Leptospira inadai serovar Lyme str. 10]